MFKIIFSDFLLLYYQPTDIQISIRWYTLLNYFYKYTSIN